MRSFDIKKTLATHLVNIGNVILESTSGTFIVKGINGRRHCVELNPVVYCSCKNVPNCIHILASKIAIAIDPRTPDSQVTVQLSTLIKKTRGKGRSGRKGPLTLPELNVLGAPDSTIFTRGTNLIFSDDELVPSDPEYEITPINYIPIGASTPKSVKKNAKRKISFKEDERKKRAENGRKTNA